MWQCKVQDYWDEEEPGKNKNKYMINNTNKEKCQLQLKKYNLYLYFVSHKKKIEITCKTCLDL